MSAPILTDLDESRVAQIAALEKTFFCDPWSETSLRTLIGNPDAVARALLCDGVAAGYYSFYAICGEAHVNNVAVAPAYQGRGLGSLLMRDLIESARARGIDAITLEVGASNDRAIGLYRRFGFESVGVRKKYYDNTEDALIMWKR